MTSTMKITDFKGAVTKSTLRKQHLLEAKRSKKAMFDFLFFSDGCEGTEEIGRFPHRPGIIRGRSHHRLFGLRRWAQRRQEALRSLSDFAFIVLAFSLKNTNVLVKYELPEDTPGEEFPKVKPSKKKSEKMESKKAVRTEPLEESIS